MTCNSVSSVALETVAHSDSISTVIKIMHKLCVRNLRTEHLLCILWHHSCLGALNTLHVVNPSARIGLTKTNTQSLITIITHYTGRGQPPALSSSITSPLAYEAHRQSSSNVWISMWRKVEQVWYLKSISAGIMNMVISSARRQAGRQAGGTCRCNSQRGPKQMRCARPLYCSFIWL